MIKLKVSKSIAVLGLILIFGLALRLFFFSGVGTSDPLAYAVYAYHLSINDYLSTMHQVNARIGVLIPVALLYRLFGTNDYTSTFFTLATSLGSIVLIFCFGRLLFNDKVGLLAAFLLSIFPLDVINSTKLLSDSPSAFFAGLSIFLFLKGEKINDSKTYIYHILSGLSMGIAFSIREMAALLVLFFIIYVIYSRKFKPSYSIIALSFIAVMALEMIFFHFFAGDALFRYHSVTGYLQDALQSHQYYGRLKFLNYFAAWPFVIFGNIQLGYFYAFILLATVYWLLHRSRNTNYMLIWLLSFLFYITFGTASLSRYAPFVAVSRYLAYVYIPGILILSMFLNENIRVIRKIILPFTIIFLLFVSVGAIYIDDSRQLLANLKDTYNFIKLFDKPVYTDSRSIWALNYISGFNNNLNFIDLGDDPQNIKNIKNAYVIINNEMIHNLIDVGYDLNFIGEIREIPLNWKLIKEIGTDKNKIIKIYSVGSK